MHDWREGYPEPNAPEVVAPTREQATRCMDCGIPFCHSGSAGCPLGNLIPEWNDLVRRNDWAQASDRLHATNNFPEFTGRLCPAPCESACVLALTPAAGVAVAIKRVEQTIADVAWERDLVVSQNPGLASGKRVAVVGSGPAGLAAAQQLTRAGHAVTVFERDDRLGGLLRYGIPDFKMPKDLIDRRIEQMSAEGTVFRVNAEIGPADVATLRADYDAVVLAVGALAPRELANPGRELGGIHQAMLYLPQGNRVQAGDIETPAIDAAGKHAVIIGGGDTAADCLGVAHRQGAAGVHQLDLYPQPPGGRDEAR